MQKKELVFRARSFDMICSCERANWTMRLTLSPMPQASGPFLDERNPILRLLIDNPSQYRDFVAQFNPIIILRLWAISNGTSPD
jgi:hypothetical protein